MSVGHQKNRKAKSQGTSRRCVHAEFRVHAAENQLVDIRLAKNILEVCTQKRIRGGFANSFVVWGSLKPLCKLPAAGSMLETPVLGLMLNKDHGYRSQTGFASDTVDTRYGSCAIKRCAHPLAQTLLNIDHKYDRFHLCESP